MRLLLDLLLHTLAWPHPITFGEKGFGFKVGGVHGMCKLCKRESISEAAHHGLSQMLKSTQMESYPRVAQGSLTFRLKLPREMKKAG